MRLRTPQHMAWIDTETTGLQLVGEHLLEVACIPTTLDLEDLAPEPLRIVVGYTRDEVAAMRATVDPYVDSMHETTGLWDQLLTSGTSLQEADDQLYNFLVSIDPRPGAFGLAGNSIRLDLNIIEHRLPRTSKLLHYRSFDMTGTSRLVEQWAGTPTPERARGGEHTALEDIRNSIDTARHIKEVLNAIHSAA